MAQIDIRPEFALKLDHHTYKLHVYVGVYSINGARGIPVIYEAEDKSDRTCYVRHPTRTRTGPGQALARATIELEGLLIE